MYVVKRQRERCTCLFQHERCMRNEDITCRTGSVFDRTREADARHRHRHMNNGEVNYPNEYGLTSRSAFIAPSMLICCLYQT